MDISSIINESGFPAGVAVYLLYLMGKHRQTEIDNAIKMTTALNNAADVIESAKEEIQKSRKEREEFARIIKQLKADYKAQGKQ